MTIVVTGGGSGGHITPILAVAEELKQLQPGINIVYVGQKGDSLADVPARDPNINKVYGVSAGKFRRYHGEGLKQLLDIKTLLLNFRDVFRVLAGIFQSWRLLRRIRPDIIFIKGGFVGVPVGLAARWLHIPFVTHDSDAIPGLANRIIGRWAQKHAVALPAEVYNYDPSKTVTVGVPVTTDYQFVTPELKAQYRQELDVPTTAQMLFIIGGGLGAQRVNEAVAQAMPGLMAQFPDLRVVHGVGRANEAAMLSRYQGLLEAAELGRLTVVGFLHDVYRYSGAADVVITRAGATNIAEFAVQGKACIVIPNPFLTAGHQLKNAAYLEEQQATEQISETELESHPETLAEHVSALLADPAHQVALGAKFRSFGHPGAAKELAQLLLNEAPVKA
ncbi:MAG: UDP-N-acetylglucosamine--N-acetylmuramyl-(pentapeptide) pyrophosphoryl-undecaprenol [Candidatus Saccharibacteria bacterium]|nr:UDP-N-acetylglucosamine--N-acetylmuramyl-(pentapeptide) pyrophosphoryl-undecaprenol [Candidatus Saccharibacteria bacterium]